MGSKTSKTCDCFAGLFPPKANENVPSGDFRCLPPTAWEAIHLRCRQPQAAESASSGDFRSLPQAAFEQLLLRFRQPEAAESASSGDFRSLPQAAFEQLLLRFRQPEAGGNKYYSICSGDEASSETHWEEEEEEEEDVYALANFRANQDAGLGAFASADDSNTFAGSPRPIEACADDSNTFAGSPRPIEEDAATIFPMGDQEAAEAKDGEAAVPTQRNIEPPQAAVPTQRNIEPPQAAVPTQRNIEPPQASRPGVVDAPAALPAAAAAARPPVQDAPASLDKAWHFSRASASARGSSDAAGAPAPLAPHADADAANAAVSTIPSLMPAQAEAKANWLSDWRLQTLSPARGTVLAAKENNPNTDNASGNAGSAREASPALLTPEPPNRPVASRIAAGKKCDSPRKKENVDFDAQPACNGNGKYDNEGDKCGDAAGQAAHETRPKDAEPLWLRLEQNDVNDPKKAVDNGVALATSTASSMNETSGKFVRLGEAYLEPENVSQVRQQPTFLPTGNAGSSAAGSSAGSAAGARERAPWRSCRGAGVERKHWRLSRGAP